MWCLGRKRKVDRDVPRVFPPWGLKGDYPFLLKCADDAPTSARKRAATETLMVRAQLTEQDRIEVTHETLRSDAHFFATCDILRGNQGKSKRQLLLFGENISQSSLLYRFLAVLDAALKTTVVRELSVITNFAARVPSTSVSWDWMVLQHMYRLWTNNKHVESITLHTFEAVPANEWGRLFCAKSCAAMPKSLTALHVLSKPDMPPEFAKRVKAVTKSNKIRKVVDRFLPVTVLVELVLACL